MNTDWCSLTGKRKPNKTERTVPSSSSLPLWACSRQAAQRAMTCSPLSSVLLNKSFRNAPIRFFPVNFDTDHPLVPVTNTDHMDWLLIFLFTYLRELCQVELERRDVCEILLPNSMRWRWSFGNERQWSVIADHHCDWWPIDLHSTKIYIFKIYLIYIPYMWNIDKASFLAFYQCCLGLQKYPQIVDKLTFLKSWDHD